MDTFVRLLNEINQIVWGPCMLVFLVGTGFYLTFKLRLLTFRRIPAAFAMLWAGRKHGKSDGELTPFNALMTALAGTIGTGSIAGVATAIYVGGPGSVFWMWVTAMVGMATKFAEILLAVHFREKTPAGNYVGGAMYFIKNGLGAKWQWLGTAFAIFAATACFGTGNAVQTNAISDVMRSTFSIPTWVTALILFGLIGAVLLGGLQRIGNVAGRVVPVMAVIYIASSLVVLIMNFTHIPTMFMQIMKDAFTDTAAQGGFAGATVMLGLRMGMARGVFANEAGLGSGPIAHATTTASPVRQATIGMLDVFITTMIVCTMTAFAILATDSWTLGVNGAPLTAKAFEAALPGFGAIIVSLSLSLFAFTTILGWCVYGERSAIYLFGDKALKPFRILYTIMVPIGAMAQLDVVWLLSDTFNALMAIPNLTGVLLLSPVVFKLVKEHEEEVGK